MKRWWPSRRKPAFPAAIRCGTDRTRSSTICWLSSLDEAHHAAGHAWCRNSGCGHSHPHSGTLARLRLPLVEIQDVSVTSPMIVQSVDTAILRIEALHPSLSLPLFRNGPGPIGSIFSAGRGGEFLLSTLPRSSTKPDRGRNNGRLRREIFKVLQGVSNDSSNFTMASSRDPRRRSRKRGGRRPSLHAEVRDGPSEYGHRLGLYQDAARHRAPFHGP